MICDELYHNVLGIERLKSIVDCGFIYKNKSLLIPCVCMTRSFNYLSCRGIRMVFDKQKLKYHYKIKPFCLLGFNTINNKKFIPKHDEYEERVFSDVDVLKTCIRIDIDLNKYNDIYISHPLINYTTTFGFYQSKLL